jgi:hypothetical protein
MLGLGPIESGPESPSICGVALSSEADGSSPHADIYDALPDHLGIAVYAKNQKENLSDAEKQALAKILQPIKQQEH